MGDKRDNCTILKIPDELWNEIRTVLPREKPPKTIGRPTVPFRKVFDGILYHSKNRMPMEDACLPDMDPVRHAIDDFRSGLS